MRVVHASSVQKSESAKKRKGNCFWENDPTESVKARLAVGVLAVAVCPLAIGQSCRKTGFLDFKNLDPRSHIKTPFYEGLH